jgi:hypothetical protein
LTDKNQSRGGEQAIREILQYLIKNPDAKDTLEGIYKWWLPKWHRKQGRAEVQQAVDLLTLRGWLTKRGTIPSKEIYGINRDRLPEIESFLQQSGASFLRE